MIRIDYKNHPKKPLPKLLHQYSSGYLILDDVLADEESFSFVYQDLLDILKYGIEKKPLREMPISFIIHHGDPSDVDHLHKLQLRHFFSNMIMWYAFMKMERVDLLRERHIIDWIGKDVKFIARYIDNEIIPIYDGDFHSLNAIVDEIIFHIKAVSDAFCMMFGYSASVYDIMQAERADPEIHHLIYDPIDVSMQPKELEALLKEKNEKLMDCFRRSDSDLRPLLESGKNISANQFREIFLRIGLKADMSNRTVPWFIPHNFLIDGISTPAAFYIIAGSGRTALMNSKLAMSKPGALSKKLNHSATAIHLRKDNETCNSTRPVYYTIEDENFLRNLDQRFYYDERGRMKLLNYKTDKHLIGKTLGFRSPCTCTSKDGICRACYGTLFDINDDLFSQGSLAATKLSEPLGQAVLSTKHEQHTDSDEIKFEDGFYKNFDLVSTEVTLADTIEDGMMIQLLDVQTEETDDGDVHYVTSFNLIDFNGELIAQVIEGNESRLYLSKDMEVAWKQFGESPIPIDRFDDDDDDSTILFNIEIKSKAKAQSYQQVTQMFDSKDHMGYAEDLDGMLQKLANVMMDTGIDYNFVHQEMVVRSLLRKKDNELEYPDFGPNGDHSNYVILRLTTSLNKNPSPLIRMSTGWLKKSLTSTALYKAHQPSHLDALFVPDLTTVIGQ